MNAAPHSGMGATLIVGSDRYAYTIVRVSPSGKTLWIKQDRAVPAEGHNYYGHQVYSYAFNPKAKLEVARKTKGGVFRVNGCMPLCVGERSYYSDPGF